MRKIPKAVFLILALTALIVTTIILVNGPASKRDERLKEGVITSMKDRRMLVLAVKGDPDKAASGAFSRLYKAYYQLPGKKKSSAPPAACARWSKPVGAPKEEWVGIYGLPVQDDLVTLPRGIKEADPALMLTIWQYGDVAQILHAGPYKETGPSVTQLASFINNSGYGILGDYEEEYLKGPGEKSAGNPDRYRTIIRYRVRKK
jgi:hypothetical protein